jgi:ElaB/YqjD/DUF883 family membrane-anchored ribosome-binding protein
LSSAGQPSRPAKQDLSPRWGKMKGNPMAGAASTTPKTSKPRTQKPAAMTASGSAATSAETNNKDLAKSRFNAALEEAKAGAAALTADARERGADYRAQAKAKSDDYAAQAKLKASELARDGKTKASDALSSLGKAVADNASTLDEKLGSKYGDYARTASRSLQETAAKIDSRSVEELSEDARELVRKNPGAAVGIAAVAGFFLARLFRR